MIQSILKKLHLKRKPSLDHKWWDQLFREFENRKVYDVLNPDILKEIPDDDLELAVVDFVELKVSTEIGDDYDRGYQVFTSLPKSFQAIHTTFYLEGEVYNGGFSQYLSNSTGLFAKEAVEGLHLIGSLKLCQLMEEAIKIEKQEMPTREKGQAMLQLDRRFYELNETDENLGELRVRFIRQNSNLFTHE